MAGEIPPSIAEQREVDPQFDVAVRALEQLRGTSHFETIAEILRALAERVGVPAQELQPTEAEELTPASAAPTPNQHSPAREPDQERAEAIDRFGLDQFYALYDLYVAQWGEKEGHERFRRAIERWDEQRHEEEVEGSGAPFHGEQTQPCRGTATDVG